MALANARASGVLTLFTCLTPPTYRTHSCPDDHQLFTSNISAADTNAIFSAFVTIPTVLLPPGFQTGQPLYVEGRVILHLETTLEWELLVDGSDQDPLGVNPYLCGDGAVGRLNVHLETIGGPLVFKPKSGRKAWIVDEERSDGRQLW